MKNVVCKTLLFACALTSALGAMQKPSSRKPKPFQEEKVPKPIVVLRNDTKHAIIITVNAHDEPPVNSGGQYTVELPWHNPSISVRYEGTSYYTPGKSVSIDIKNILEKAQANDAIVPIIEGRLFPLAIGTLEFVHFPRLQEKEGQVAPAETGFQHIGLSENERKAYRLLNVEPTAKAYEILGILRTASQDDVRKAFRERSQALREFKPEPSEEVKKSYMAIIRNAADQLTPSDEEIAARSLLDLPTFVLPTPYEILGIQHGVSLQELREALEKRRAILSESVGGAPLSDKVKKVLTRMIENAYEAIKEEK